ncbi:MAG: hypothetical protein V7K15_11940 [Nostoc sp.]
MAPLLPKLGEGVEGKFCIEYFNFNDQINRLYEANLLFLIVKNFAEINLHPDEVNSMEIVTGKIDIREEVAA